MHELVPDTPHVEQVVLLGNIAIGKLVEIGRLPAIWEVAGVIWSELTLEWPDGVVEVLTELVVVGETLHGHVAYVFAELGKLSNGRHEVAFVSRAVYVSIFDWFQEIESVALTLKGVQSEVVSNVDTISEPFNASGCRWDEVWCNRADLRDVVHSVVSSSERASESVVMEVVELVSALPFVILN